MTEPTVTRTIFDPIVAHELRTRVAELGAANAREWGTMTAAQAMAHCATGLEFAVGDRTAPRMFIGRVLGSLIKPLALGRGEMRRNSPTVPDLVVQDERELEAEKQRVLTLVDRFVAGGRAGCTTSPHSFFGRMNPDEWGVLMYKHLDHHLRQFGG